ncbi:MAG TPA: hypothetical protein VJ725_29005 [Thermoanaerobaculia bacterium]|nr:hypothetical protein [Thermoanaerobaculia bacterium]
MRFRIEKHVLLAFGLTLALAYPALAAPVHYGTGIHHWAKICDNPYPGASQTVEYVGAASCPPYVTLPSNCRCVLTAHDFPVNNPYPYLVATGFDVSDPVHVDFIIDQAQVIQCNETTAPTPGGQICNGDVCGDRFGLVPADPATLEDGFLETAELLRPEFEKRAGGQPVEFIFWYAERLPE